MEPLEARLWSSAFLLETFFRWNFLLLEISLEANGFLYPYSALKVTTFSGHKLHWAKNFLVRRVKVCGNPGTIEFKFDG